MKTETLTCDFCGTVIDSGIYARRKKTTENLKTKHEKTMIDITVKKRNFSDAEFTADVCDKCLAELLNEAADLLQENATSNDRKR